MEFTHAVLKGVIWNDLEWWWSIAQCLWDSWASCTMFNCIITVCWTDRFTHHRMLFSSQSLVSFQFITPSTYYQFHVFSMWLLRVCWSVVRLDSFWRAVFKNPVFTTRLYMWLLRRAVLLILSKIFVKPAYYEVSQEECWFSWYSLSVMSICIRFQVSLRLCFDLS